MFLLKQLNRIDQGREIRWGECIDLISFKHVEYFLSKMSSLHFWYPILLGATVQILAAEFGDERPIIDVNKVRKAHSRPELPAESIGDGVLGPN